MNTDSLKTIISKIPMSFTDALAALRRGECLGIKPQQNSQYMTLSKQPDSLQKLVWGNGPDGTCRAEQFEGEWFPVLVDHRTL